MLNVKSPMAALLAAAKLAAADGPVDSTPQALHSAALSGSSPSTLLVGDQHAGAIATPALHTMSLPAKFRETTAASNDAAGEATHVEARQKGSGSETSRIPTTRDIHRGFAEVELALDKVENGLDRLSNSLQAAQGRLTAQDSMQSNLRLSLEEISEIKQNLLEAKGELDGTSRKVNGRMFYHAVEDAVRKAWAEVLGASAVCALAFSWFSSRKSS